MAHINDLPIPALSSLSETDGLQLILDIRLRRRFVPTRAPKDHSVRSSKKQKIADPLSMINSLNDEQLLALLTQLGGTPPCQ